MFAIRITGRYNKFMYLISLYFDEKTNKKIQLLIDNIACGSDNTYMIDKQVPPHLTLMAFESKLPQDELIGIVEKVVSRQPEGQLHWVSAGIFFPQVIYLAPVLNEYLQRLMEKVYDALSVQPDTKIQACYRPYSWFPHTTVAKKLSQEQMQAAFAVLQKEFAPFEGHVVKIGLSETTPKREIISWNTIER